MLEVAEGPTLKSSTKSVIALYHVGWNSQLIYVKQGNQTLDTVWRCGRQYPNKQR